MQLSKNDTHKFYSEIEIEDKINKCGLSSKQSLTLEEAQKRNKDLLKVNGIP